MRSNYLVPVVGLLVVLIVLAGVVYYFSVRNNNAVIVPVEEAYTPPEKLTVTEVVAGAGHTYSGSFDIPSCNTLASGITSTGGTPINLTLVLRVITTDPSCTDTSLIEQPFILSFTPAAAVTVRLASVTLNGKEIPFTLTEQKSN